MEKNSIFTGIITGIFVPIIGFYIVEYIFEILTAYGFMDYVSASTSDKRMRTLALIGLCFNIIPMHIFKNNGWIESMRGIIFPTLIYVGFWIYKFYTGLF